MLEEAVLHMEGPVAIRYPRGTEGAYKEDSGTQAAVVLRDGKDITLVSYGIEVNDVLEAARILSEHGVEAEIVKLNVLTPLEPGVAAKSVRKTGALLVAEDCMAEGCVGQRLAAALEEKQISARVCLLNCGTEFVPHGALNFLKRDLNLDGEGIAHKALEVLGCG